MKKLLMMIIIACLLFCSCGSTLSPEDLTEPVRLSSSYENLNLNGEFYCDAIDGSVGALLVLKFIDFDTMQISPVCSKPNCAHNNKNSCTAFGMQNHPTIIGNNLFYFQYVYEYDKEGNTTEYVNVWKADLDGSNRVKIDTLDGIAIEETDYAAVIGSKIFFVGMEKESKALTDMSMGLDKYYICSYDCAKEKFVNHGYLCEGYNGGARVYGRYNGGLYIGASYEAEQYDYKKGINGYWEHYEKNYRSNYFRFDLETGEITKSDMPSLDKGGFVTDELYGYRNENGRICVIDADGNSRLYENFNYIGGYPINGHIFNTDNNTALELASGAVKKLKSSVVPQFYTVTAYYNGSYILVNSINPRSYISMSAEKLFVE